MPLLLSVGSVVPLLLIASNYVASGTKYIGLDDFERKYIYEIAKKIHPEIRLNPPESGDQARLRLRFAVPDARHYNDKRISEVIDYLPINSTFNADLDVLD